MYYSKKTKIDLLTVIQITVISIMFVWKIIPQLYYLYRGPLWVLVYQMLFFAWLGSSFLKSGVWFCTLKNEMIPISIFIVYVLVEGIVFPNVQPGYLALVVSFWEIAIIYYYYSNINVKHKAAQSISIISLIAMLIGSVQSIRAIGVNSLAVRLASSSNLDDVSLMAGNYTFTAMLTILVPVMILMIISGCRLIVKIFCAVFSFLAIYFTMKCNLLISFICMVIGVAMVFLLPKGDKLTVKKLIYYAALILVAVVVLSSTTILLRVITIFENIIGSDVINARLELLRRYIMYGALEGDFSGRINLSLIALKTFFQYPVFGIGPQNDWDIYFRTQLGLHATLWDDFARYGIVGMSQYFFAFKLIYRSNTKNMSTLARKGYFVGITEYFLISMLNPTIAVNVGIALFMVLPICCQFITDNEHRTFLMNTVRSPYAGAENDEENLCNYVVR